MRVFVAGATGALGRALIRRLVEERHSVRAVAPRPAGACAPPAVDADLCAHDLRELVRGCDAVVDLTTAPDTVTTRRLLDASVACGVRRYVQRSFAMVYRDGGDRWLDEDAPLDETARRSVACRPVIETEAMIRLIDPQALAWTILRGGSFVGAGTRQDALIDRLRSRGAVVAGDGSNYLSPLNVADMASAVAAALRHAPAGSTFNIVDEPLRYSDYIDALADLIGVTRPPRAAAKPLGESRRCTNSAARTVLGWTPRHPIWPSRRAAGELTSSSSGWT
ncbi:MAG TPA: NAD(P)-dependent oxidoreductase [Gaiellaceae bacterium]|nr:NAD(P)-dependent oxidoreductase [Gaiellaceae bacterium]